LLELVRKKIDPMEADKAQLQAAADAKWTDERLAFSTYSDFFIKKHAEARKLRSTEDIRSVFRRDLKPHFGNKAISSLRRTDVQAMIDVVGERSGSAANKAHKWLRKMLTFAVERGDIASSPMESMGRPHEEGKRQRVLRGQELVRVWKAADEVGQPWSAFLRLLLLTGQRLREVAKMRWEEVDVSVGTWTIPGARTKNGRDHLVPLSPQALGVLEVLQPDAKLRSGPVLTTNGKVPINGFSKLKVSLDKLVQEEAGSHEPWVFHDLRRSLATGVQALGFPIEHTEAVLNHVSGKRGGLASIYQLHEYQDEKASVLKAWGRHVEALVEGGSANVVELRRAR
jgi:integrase